jgi:hypothetical protein
LAGSESPRQRIVIFRRRDAGPPSGPLQAFLNCLSDLRPTLQERAQLSTA